MKSRLLIKIVWLLAILGVGYGSSFFLESLDSRLCRALFVFKFRVLSSQRNIGCAGSPLKSVEYLVNTTLTSPPPTTETTTGTTTTTTTTTSSSSTTTTTAAGATSRPAQANKTTGKISNLHRILSTQPGPTRQQRTNLSTASSFQTRRKRCYQIQAQLISIRGNGVFKGKDILKKMSNVVESKLKDNYFSYVRPDLNWEKELSSGDYLFIGRIKGVFLSNGATVVPWDKTLETKIKKFDFATNCKKQN